MSWLRDLSLSIKINLLIVVAVGILAATILGVQVVSANNLIDEIGQARIQQELSLIEANLEDAQAALANTATLLANTTGLVEAVETGNANALRTLYLNSTSTLEIDDFDIVDTQGNSLFTALEDDAEHAEAEEALFNQTLLGIQRTLIFVEQAGEETGLKLASIRPIRNDLGAIIGGMLLIQDLGDEFLNTLNLEREGIELSLIYNNQIVAESFETHNGEAMLHEHIVSFETSLVSASLSGTVSTNPETIFSEVGIPHTEAYLPVQGLDDRNPIAVLAVRVNNEAIGTFRDSLINNSTIVLAVLTLAIIISILVLIHFLITRPIKVLQTASATIAQGDYAKRVNMESRDELGQLAEAFNLMASDVQQRQTQLQKLNQSLEQRVADRTADMQTARDEAQALAQLANESSRLKSEFLSTMSHELRTPMNAIEGFTGIMLERMGGVEFNDKTEDYLTKIEWNSRRLLGLINDFLDLSRIESGRLELVYLPISLSEMAQKWHDNFSVLAENKDLGFEVIVDSNLPETFYADQESLSKIAINLLGNAAKFTEAGTIALRLEKRNDMVALEVSDTGIGIPPHARDFIFDEFRQVDQSSTREHGGTGLGLSIVQKLVRAMNGQISLESEVGVGSTFTVLLPIRKEGQVVVGVAS